MNKQQITSKLQQLGMAWATRSDKYVSQNDGWGSKPAYHVHPDASYPHQDSIKRFYNLAEIEAYIAAREAANDAPDEATAWRIMEEYNLSLM